MRENQKKIDSILIYFLLCLYRLKDTVIIQVMKVMKTSFLSHRPQPLPPEVACNTIHCKAFFEEFTATPPLVPCLVRAGRLVRGARLNSTLVLQVGG